MFNIFLEENYNYTNLHKKNDFYMPRNKNQGHDCSISN